ncbi:hypothetical protein [Williamsia sp. DF01-3]|nr:hypothetical protein [Williamsia sp. DF01-3]
MTGKVRRLTSRGGNSIDAKRRSGWNSARFRMRPIIGGRQAPWVCP